MCSGSLRIYESAPKEHSQWLPLRSAARANANATVPNWSKSPNQVPTSRTVVNFTVKMGHFESEIIKILFTGKS